MSAEERLRELFAGELADYQPSPDLFARVERSIDGDVRRRAWRRRWVGWLAAAVVGLGSVLGLGAALGPDGLDTRLLELVTLVTLVGVVVTLAPFIRRFGLDYVHDVFVATPEVGRSYRRLTELTYYFVLLGYSWFAALSVSEGEPSQGVVGADELSAVAVGLGGLLLLAGVLHAVNLVLLPVVSRLVLLNRRYGPFEEE